MLSDHRSSDPINPKKLPPNWLIVVLVFGIVFAWSVLL